MSDISENIVDHEPFVDPPLIQPHCLPNQILCMAEGVVHYKSIVEVDYFKKVALLILALLDFDGVTQGKVSMEDPMALKLENAPYKAIQPKTNLRFSSTDEKSSIVDCRLMPCGHYKIGVSSLD